MTPVRHTLRGIAAMVASQLAFLLNDTLIKLASDALPMGEIIFLRGLFASALIGAILVATGLHRQLPALWNRMVIWRGIGELGGTFFYLLALFHMPIGNATIIFQAVPLTATAGAALFLGEKVSWRRWSAIVIGFLGVLLVVRPGLTGFDAYGLLVLVSVMFVAMRDLTTRAMPLVIPTVLVTFGTAVLVTLMGAAMGLTERWLWPGGTHLLQLAGAGFFLAIGYFTIIAAMRLGDISVTAAFRYVAVVFAIAIGFMVWGDVPDALTVVGSGIIVGTGLYTFNRARRLRNGAAAEGAAAAAAVAPPI